MKTSDFYYQLPPELIAQTPIEPRDHSRLMVLNRAAGTIEHRRFDNVMDFLQPGDLLVCNESRVIPARLLARRADTGGRLEILLLRQIEDGVWETLVKPGKRARPGTPLILEARPIAGAGGNTVAGTPAGSQVTAEILERTDAGGRIIRFADPVGLELLGTMPLPPYIKAPLACPDRYQTVYARLQGSVAAPTAGLHFTPELISRLQGLNVEFGFVTLHIGLDTFRPVEEEEAEQHAMHSEHIQVGEDIACKISQAKTEGRRIVAVGTTVVRALESAARIEGRGDDLPLICNPYTGSTRLFILPGFGFKVVDAMITNFHLPRSTLLMMVSAFAGRDFILRAYAEAVSEQYRFYSFGDAMLIS